MIPKQGKNTQGRAQRDFYKTSIGFSLGKYHLEYFNIPIPLEIFSIAVDRWVDHLS